MDQVHLLGGNSYLQNPIYINVNSTLDIKISQCLPKKTRKQPNALIWQIILEKKIQLGAF